MRRNFPLAAVTIHLVEERGIARTSWIIFTRWRHRFAAGGVGVAEHVFEIGALEPGGWRFFAVTIIQGHARSVAPNEVGAIGNRDMIGICALQALACFQRRRSRTRRHCGPLSTPRLNADFLFAEDMIPAVGRTGLRGLRTATACSDVKCPCSEQQVCDDHNRGPIASRTSRLPFNALFK